MSSESFPPLSALRAFEAAARLLSIKRAAEELNVTSAAVSYQIKQLEAHLGVQLFERQNRRILLTDVGRRCAAELSQGFESLHRAVALARAERDDGRLVISTGPAFAVKWLAPRILALQEAYPELEPRVMASLGFTDFHRDGIDVAIRFGEPTEPPLHAELLVEERVAPLCSPELWRKSGQNPRKLLAETRLVETATVQFPGSPTWLEWAQASGVDLPEARRELEFTQGDYALQAAIDSVGVVLGRVALAEPDLRAGRLIRPFGKALATGEYFQFVCPPEKLQRRAVRCFRDWIRAEMASLRA